MHPKVAEVISGLHQDYFKSHKEMKENRFYFVTQLTELFDHATYIFFEAADDVLRVDIRHIFGAIDVENHMDFDSMLELLSANSNSFRMSSAYLAIEIKEKVLYTSLQTYRTFLMKWPSAEIADQINLAFFDIKSSFMLGPWPASIQLFSKSQ